ncbi:pPIWI_RE_Z domain-containing protein [Actinophytocola xanthii]|uniref:Signal recognition particle n=1 Tax=Actinophytocola xanthii TaxID=1912961 RepID=A0A1Q8BVZ7_9PSEU|nr:signal recognition particle [Actinophytocola xanthii]OLF06262.1 signal recognition particle [Actinophytocola xanthii]
MRDRSGWHAQLLGQLTPVWPATLGEFRPGQLMDVELGLYLLGSVMPDRPAKDAWTLFGGYPYSEVFGTNTADAPLRVMRGRHYLWDMRRRREWERAVEAYLEVPEELRGCTLAGLDSVPVPRQPSRAAHRFEVYETLLTTPPAFARQPLPLAGPGEYEFYVRDRRYSVTFPPELLATIPAPLGHALPVLPPRRGEVVEVTWKQLEDAAAKMDAIELNLPGKPNEWVRRLGRVKLLIRDDARGEFAESTRLRVDRLMNLVGMVGAGKSTLRDILAFWAATETGRRITIVVGDVAETLTIVDQFTRLGINAAPVLGHSTRERNLERLHRRMASAGAETMLGHDHPSFDYLSSACPLDALRGLDASNPLRIGEAPCTALYEVRRPQPDADDLFPTQHRAGGGSARSQRRARHGCPLWTVCPRHHGARSLVDAQVWVATPASLVHSGVPPTLQAERLRHLELACRMSDLVIVDEADRVQMQLDRAFAPATTLVGRSPNSWLDEVAGHKVAELARRGRVQLSAQEVDDWTSSVDTVSTATDRLYALLVGTPPLAKWITADYFSAMTLHQWLIRSWFPDIVNQNAATDDTTGNTTEDSTDDPTDAAAAGAGSGAGGGDRESRRSRMDYVEAVLDQFRDDPLEEQLPRDDNDRVTPTANALVHLTLQLLHAHRDSVIRQRLREVLLDLVDQDPRIADDLETHAQRFELTLILAALHHRLDRMTILWPRVEAALNLEATSNVLSRRPPKDYEPVIPESPMGNVLGFQFQLGERTSDGDQSGELRFFRCSGVGRELLLGLPDLPVVDDRPGPHVLFMSATSWAGTSTRYHVHAPVDAVLRPHDDEVAAILNTTLRTHFLYWPGTSPPKPLRLSGSGPDDREKVLEQMLNQLAIPDRSLGDASSMLDVELADIDDPDRRRILLLVGSYAEAKHAARHLDNIPEWSGRVTQLVSDDADLDNSWMVLRRGELTKFPDLGSEILVAPLLAVERGYNIVLAGGKAAIGSVYFLARPHPRPDDIALAIHAINDWAVRQIRDPARVFHATARAAGTPDHAALAFRRTARQEWNRFLTRQMAWSSLTPDEKISFTWDQLVVMWQVIGRLVRGGVPARVVCVDAAFAPRQAGFESVDTPATSLLASMRAVLEPYFTHDPATTTLDRSLVHALYEPLYQALADLD